MNCLVVDTTSKNLAIALLTDSVRDCYVQEVGKSGHSTILLKAIDTVLEKNKVDISQIDTVGVVVGPGSFTGIRIGVSAMSAIAFANCAKRITVTSFDIIAYNRAKVMAAVDAGHGNLYLAECENGVTLQTNFVVAQQAQALDKTSLAFEPCCEYSQALLGVVEKKLANGEFVSVLEPFYMRKSQAEREKDEV